MHSVESALEARGGVAPRARLLADGLTDERISAALRRGTIVRPRQGWFALPAVGPRVLGAVRSRGRLACRSALAHHGVWVLDDGLLHVELQRTSARPSRFDTPVALHWRMPARSLRADTARPVATVVEALWCFTRCATLEDLRCALESALNQGLLDRGVAIGMLRNASSAARADLVAESESGLETLARIRLARVGIRARPQVTLATGARVDLLIGDRLVIELDGSTWHDGEDRTARDRSRDAALTALGFRVLRFGFPQVVGDWPTVEAAILRVVDDGGHISAPREMRNSRATRRAEDATDPRFAADS